MILYSAADLIWATKIKSMADDLGIPCRPVRSVEMLEARLADSPVRALVVDLEAPEVGLALIARLRGAGAGERDRGGGVWGGKVRIVAFGPHVAKDLLQAARDAGADDVMPRGAFDHGMADILRGLQ